MRGLVRRDLASRSVVVEGRANLLTCGTAGMVLWAAGQHDGWLFIGLLTSFLVASYVLQARRYRRIARVIAGKAMDADPPPPSQTSPEGNVVAWVLLAALVGLAALVTFVR